MKNNVVRFGVLLVCLKSIFGCGESATSSNKSEEEITRAVSSEQISYSSNQEVIRMSSSFPTRSSQSGISSAISSNSLHISSAGISSSFKSYLSSSGDYSSSAMAYSSSQQALQFQGKQVRIPDGCGLVRWGSGDEYTCVNDFWVDTVEVTIEEYQTTMGGGTPSLYRSGKFTWPNSSGGGLADDGSPCPKCPADAVTIYEAMLYANKITKQLGRPEDTVYSYSSVDTVTATGYYGTTKGSEISVLHDLVIDQKKAGYRLPTQGEFEYMCLKSNLLWVPWEDIFPDSSATSLFSKEISDLFESPDYVPPPVGLKRHTTWFLHDLFGSAPEWSTTQNPEHKNNFFALGTSHDAVSDLRLDRNHAGFRLVRGYSTVSNQAKQ